MVNGVNGVGTGSSPEDLKAFVQELLEETLAENGVSTANNDVTTESTDEDSGVTSEENQTPAQEEIEVRNPITKFMTGVTDLYDSIMEALLSFIGTGEKDSGTNENMPDKTTVQ